jgi:uncharacterized membrane protein YphA (DoxX/SURF4 family)
MIDRTFAIWTGRLVRLVVGAIFIYAGLAKVTAPVRFTIDIHNYHLLPWPMTVALAFYLPWLEIGCGLALLLGRLYQAAVSILVALTIIFIVASASARIRGIDITCGCFGHLSNNLSFGWHLALDIVLLIVLVALWSSKRPRLKVDG